MTIGIYIHDFFYITFFLFKNYSIIHSEILNTIKIMKTIKKIIAIINEQLSYIKIDCNDKCMRKIV